MINVVTQPISAKEARDISKHANYTKRNFDVKIELSIIFRQIRTACDNGNTSIVVFAPFTETLDELTRLGYKYKMDMQNFYISW